MRPHMAGPPCPCRRPPPFELHWAERRALRLYFHTTRADHIQALSLLEYRDPMLAKAWTLIRMLQAMGIPRTPALDDLVAATPPAAIVTALEWVDSTHGGAAGYLRSGGLTDAELDALRRRLVTVNYHGDLIEVTTALLHSPSLLLHSPSPLLHSHSSLTYS